MARFLADGVQLVVGDTTFRVQMVGVGRTRRTRPPAIAPPTPPRLGKTESGAPRVEYTLAQSTEWWMADRDGLEQGWTIRARPAGAGPLRLQLRLTGASATKRDDAPEALRLTGPVQDSWRVDRLHATDAGGASLTARFVPTQDGFDIVVDDQAAAYPVEIDPFYAAADWEVSGTPETGVPTDVATADFDSDGYADLAALFSTGVHVYRGTADGLDETPALTFGSIGEALASAGDVNGDGYPDLVVGVPDEAAIVVYEGSPTGLSSEGNRIASEVASTWEYFGRMLDGAGDVNGDGYDDIVVSSYTADYAAVFMGSADGTVATPGFEVTGSDRLGWRVGAAGDVNGDGFDDVGIAGESYETHVYYGGSGGLSSSRLVTLATARSAQAIGGVGDLDDDGYADFAVACSSGVYVYPGAASGLDPAVFTELPEGATAVVDGGDVAADGVDALAPPC